MRQAVGRDWSVAECATHLVDLRDGLDGPSRVLAAATSARASGFDASAVRDGGAGVTFMGPVESAGSPA